MEELESRTEKVSNQLICKKIVFYKIFHHTYCNNQGIKISTNSEEPTIFTSARFYPTFYFPKFGMLRTTKQSKNTRSLPPQETEVQGRTQIFQ